MANVNKDSSGMTFTGKKTSASLLIARSSCLAPEMRGHPRRGQKDHLEHLVTSKSAEAGIKSGEEQV